MQNKGRGGIRTTTLQSKFLNKHSFSAVLVPHHTTRDGAGGKGTEPLPWTEIPTCL